MRDAAVPRMSWARLLELARAHPTAARNLLFVLIGFPLAWLGRVLADHYAAAIGPVLSGLAPVPGIAIGLLAARLIADRLGVPRR